MLLGIHKERLIKHLGPTSFMSARIRCCQKSTARKTPAISHGLESWRGIDQELINFRATLCTNSCLAISCCFSPGESAYKIWLASCWPRVGFVTNISVFKLQGSFLRGSLATPKRTFRLQITESCWKKNQCTYTETNMNPTRGHHELPLGATVPNCSTSHRLGLERALRGFCAEHWTQSISMILCYFDIHILSWRHQRKMLRRVPRVTSIGS